MAKPTVMVIGATGAIGSATVSALTSKYSDQLEISAGVRDPEKAAAKLKDVKLVKAEMGSAELETTLKGIDSLFIVSPSAENRAALTVKTAEAAKAAGVKFLLVVSVPTAVLPDTIFGGQFHEVETKVKALGTPACFIRLPYFADNVWGSKATIQGQSTMYGPVDPDKPFTAIVTADAGKAAAAILSNPDKHIGQTYELVSHRVTQAEMAATFSALLEREVKYVQIPYEQAKQTFLGFGFQEWQAKGMMELFKMIDGGHPTLTTLEAGDTEKITGEKPVTFKEFLTPIIGAFK